MGVGNFSEEYTERDSWGFYGVRGVEAYGGLWWAQGLGPRSDSWSSACLGLQCRGAWLVSDISYFFWLFNNRGQINTYCRGNTSRTQMCKDESCLELYSQGLKKKCWFVGREGICGFGHRPVSSHLTQSAEGALASRAEPGPVILPDFHQVDWFLVKTLMFLFVPGKQKLSSQGPLSVWWV